MPLPVLKLCILPTVNNLGKGQALSTPTEGSGDVRGFPWFLPSFRVSCTHSRLRLRQYATGTCEPQLTLTQSGAQTQGRGILRGLQSLNGPRQYGLPTVAPLKAVAA